MSFSGQDGAKELMARIHAEAQPWAQALAKLAQADAREDARSAALSTLQGLAKLCPTPLDKETHAPEAGPETPEKAALHYRLANEALRAYAQAPKGMSISRGLLLDFWDVWWTAASGLSGREAAQRVAEHMEPNEGLARRVVQPDLIRDALCACDRDVAFLLAGKGGLGGDGALVEQLIWQMRRLHGSSRPFAPADRAALYELLLMRGLSHGDGESGFLAGSLEILCEATKAARSALETGKTSIPTASEQAFRSGEGSDGQGPQAERALALATLQFIASAQALGLPLKAAVERAHEAARRFGFAAPEDEAADLRRLVLRLAARSRMIRHAMLDLLDHRFPTPIDRPPEPRPVEHVCDCWVSVVGRRKAGKSYFMLSLAAALLPNDRKLSEAEQEKDANRRAAFWNSSRVRLLDSQAFAQNPDRAGLVQSALRPSSPVKSGAMRLGDEEGVREDLPTLLAQWLKQENIGRTTPAFNHVAEIDTPSMARLRFFDLAGEQIMHPELNELHRASAKMMREMNPVAAVIIDEDDEDANRENAQAKYVHFAQHIAGAGAPVYIVVNKADKLLEQEGRSEEAREELTRSMSYRDRPEEWDADAPWLPFLSLRDMAFSETGPRFEDLLEHIDSAPPLARRPYFQKRLRHDVLRLENMIRALLEAGRQDVSLLYLVAARDKRDLPADFNGHRLLWGDLEARVLDSTRRSRRAAVRRLLVEDPVASEQKATEVYGRLDSIFQEALPHLLSVRSEPPEKPVRIAAKTAIDWTDLCESPDSDADLRLAWRRASHGVAARESFARSLGEAALTLLPELGVDPEEVFAQRNFSHLGRPSKDNWDRLGLQEVVEQVKDAFQKKGALHKDLDKLMREAFVGVEDHSRSRYGESGTETRYTLRDGVSGALGVAGSPALDKRLSETERIALRQVNGAYGDAILKAEDPSSALALARALRGIQPRARYGHLALEQGERDFHRVRVLSEPVELGGKLEEFQTTAFEALQQILVARSALSNVKTETVVDLEMCEALRSKLAQHAAIAPLDQLIDPKNGEAFQALQALIDQGADLQQKMKAKQTESGFLGGLSLLKSQEEKLADLYSDKENAGIWPQLMPSSLDAARRLSISKNGDGADAEKVYKAPEELNRNLTLLRRLLKTVQSLRIIGPADIEAARELAADPLAAMAQPEKIEDPFTQLQPRLIRLRLLRRQLLVGYALRMLRMGGWIGGSGHPKGEARDLMNRADQSLTNAMEALEALFEDLSDGGAKEFRGESVGRPHETRFSVTKHRDAEVLKNEDYLDLIERLGLVGAAEEPSAIWGGERRAEKRTASSP